MTYSNATTRESWITGVRSSLSGVADILPAQAALESRSGLYLSLIYNKPVAKRSHGTKRHDARVEAPEEQPRRA